MLFSCGQTRFTTPAACVKINPHFQFSLEKEVVKQMILLLLIGFGASVVGAICGIGGGVIIKPLLDVMGIAGVAEISFLSGCTVLCMSCYSVIKALSKGESLVSFDTGTPLAIGAAIGGIAGKNLFSLLQGLSAQPERVGGYQSICLAVVTAVTLLYTLRKDRIRTHRMRAPLFCVAVGLALGCMSSFLGIGGGPINLVVLYYFFSMDTKTAAQNSLYIILISQASSLLFSLLTGSVPSFHLSWLLTMALSGIAGGIAGRRINKRLSAAQVDRLFTGLIAVIIGISCCNAWRFLGGA